MKHRGRLLEVLRKAEEGPLMEERDFEKNLITPTVKRLIDKYELKFNRDTIITSDDNQSDRLFQAGLEFAVEVGLYCKDTNRRILWSHQEYEDALRSCPSQAIMGADSDAVTIRARKPESLTRVVVSGGPVGVPVPEDLYVPLMLSYAKEPVIDILEPASIESAYGMPMKAGSPLEILAGWRDAELAFQVINQAGRPGMCLACVTISATAIGQISPSSYGGFRPSDWHHCSVASEFKTNYELLSKVAHTTRIGGNMESYLNIIFGGYFGGAEGVAIGLTAGPIILNQNYMGTTFSVAPSHPFLHCGSTPELIWAQSSAFQALSKNTNLLLGSMIKPAGGPGTKSLLYENAALAIANVSSGISVVESCMSASGTNPRHASGLDSKFCGEVAHAATGMSRGQADEIVKQLIEKYEQGLDQKPAGKPFEEVYDIETITPTAEWQGIYDEVKVELQQMGLPID
jgi:methylamine--corrinoid protein Co-methyltransferase